MKVFAESRECVGLVAIVSTNMDVDLGIRSSGKPHGVEDERVNLQVSDSIEDHAVFA